VSSGEGREAAPEREGLQALEGVVSRVLEELDRLRLRIAEAQRRNAELEALLSSFQTGEESPANMKERLTRLERENRDLLARVERGRETVLRLLARIDFIEDQR